MTSPNVIPLVQPRHHRPGNVTNLHRASITVLSEHRSLPDRYDLHRLQAAGVNASIGELWLRAYLTSIQVALCIAGLSVRHAPTMERTTCAMPAGKTPEDFREPA